MTDLKQFIDMKLTRSELIDLMVHEALADLRARHSAALKEFNAHEAEKPVLTREEVLAHIKDDDWSVGDYGHKLHVNFSIDIKGKDVPPRFAEHRKKAKTLKAAMNALQERIDRVKSKTYRNEVLKKLLENTADGKALLALVESMKPSKKLLTP